MTYFSLPTLLLGISLSLVTPTSIAHANSDDYLVKDRIAFASEALKTANKEKGANKKAFIEYTASALDEAKEALSKLPEWQRYVYQEKINALSKELKTLTNS